RITADLITNGYVRHPWIGIGSTFSLADYPGLARYLRLDTENGLMIVEVYDNGPASRAGLRGATRAVSMGFRRLPVDGDVIVQFNAKPLNTVQDLLSEIDRYKPGDRVTLTILRGGKKLDVPVVLDDAPRK